jgi:diguanylate cyclase (GGDEF)-like protein/PAS domain S-box-containing protein
MAPLSGLVALYGREIVQAAEIAVAEINANGGVLGRELRLVVEDDGSMPEPALAAATRLIDEHHCAAMIGNLLSNSRIAVASQIAEPRRIPYLNFSFYEGSIHGRYFFHFAALPNQQIDRMIPSMMARCGPKIFFAGSNYEWPRGSIDAARNSMIQHGGEVVGERYLPFGATRHEIDELITEVSHSGADLFVPYFAGDDQITLLNTFAERGLKQRMAVVMGHYDEAMVRHLRPEVREGFYSSNTYFMSLQNARNLATLATLATMPGVNGLIPEGDGVLTNFGEGVYACVHAYAAAVQAAGSSDAEAVVAALEQVEIDSCQGTIKMDAASHHAHVNTYLARCRADGSFEIIEAFGQIAPEIPARYRQDEAATPVANGELPPPPIITALPPAGSSSSIDTIFQQILNNADIAVIATDHHGTILQANLGACQLFGYQSEEFIGMSVHSLVPPHQRTLHAVALERFASGSATALRMGQRGSINAYRKDGSIFPAEASISKFSLPDGWILVATLRDITDRLHAEEELAWRASHDPLTSLPNRSLIRERLSRAIARSDRNLQGLALLFIDLDHFKLINDNYGHNAGDDLLITVANRLLAQVRPGDTVGRLGGDEFVILCEHIDHLRQVEYLAERINQTLRQPLQVADQAIVCTVSIGIALRQGGDEGSADDLLRQADTAMYLSKEQGRDGWRLFSHELTEQSRQRLTLVNGLRQAIERDELQLMFQPIVTSQSGAIRGAEALLRWTPASGPVSPALFIPIAEQSGAIHAIGRWVFEQTCQMQVELARRWPKETPYLSFNLSARQLDDEAIIDHFRATLTASGANPTALLIELTETSLLQDSDKTRRQLQALAELGLAIAVDDFGTGHSSLLQLLRLPVTTIKIDREFIDGLDKRSDARLITSAIIKMGKALGKRIIAEGVENEAQLFELQALQCDAIQGYLFYRPLTAADLISAITAAMQSQPDRASQVYYVIYVSEAQPNLSHHTLHEILSVSRRRNRDAGITGFLIYQHGYFMQLLEGRQEMIEPLMARIAADPRHQQPIVILRGYAPRRLFSDWSMGFWNMDKPTEPLSDNFEQWQGQTLSLLDASRDARFCYALFEAMSRTNSYQG